MEQKSSIIVVCSGSKYPCHVFIAEIFASLPNIINTRKQIKDKKMTVDFERV